MCRQEGVGEVGVTVPGEHWAGEEHWGRWRVWGGGEGQKLVCREFSLAQGLSPLWRS